MRAAPGAVLGGRLPLLPCGTTSQGRSVRGDVGGHLWGWTSPTAHRFATERAGRAIADVELPDWGKPGQVKAESAAAEEIASHAVGVTSHGFAPARLAHALGEFAVRDLTGFPQVFDSDRSTAPRVFLLRCLSTWRDMGFDRLVPLLGLSAGRDAVRIWIEICEDRGLDWHLWSLGEWREDARGWSKLVGEYLPQEKIDESTKAA